VRSVRSFPAELGSVKAARHFARAALSDVPPAAADAVELLVSELATNSIKHADTAFELVVELSASEVIVEVTDNGPGEPSPRDPAPTDPSGRGLRIVDLMSDKWGVRRAGQTKTVWFLVRTTPPARDG
jgi:anti-sigma regulatory factor (Ser/Thr protein kinase)